MTTAAGRYDFRETPETIVVGGEDRCPVEVRLTPYGIEARHVGRPFAGSRAAFGFYNFGRLLDFVAAGLMREWRAKDGWFGVRDVAERQTARAVAVRLREAHARMLRKADPAVLDVQRAIFAATFGDAPLMWSEEFYRRRFLVKDVLNHPAAAACVRNAEELCRDRPLNRLALSPEAKAMLALANKLGLALRLDASLAHAATPEWMLDQLDDWKGLLSPDGTAYTSLNRTLMNLPGGVPHRALCNLRHVRLERPVVRRLELLAVLMFAAVLHERGLPTASDRMHQLQHAHHLSLKSAMARLAEHLRRPLCPRKPADVRELATHLADYPDAHHGSLPGLIDKTIRWHRDRLNAEAEAMLARYGRTAATRLPPIALPALPEVRFLDSVGSIVTEAEHMHHCVATYVDRAVSGNCYLFHVEYRGESATVEVGCEGRVRQAQGPRNARNAAASWGKRVLNKWATTMVTAGHAAGVEDDEAD